MTDRIFVGIDIGWSLTRRSCGVATSGGSLVLPGAVSYGSGVVATKVRLDELKSMLGRWSHEHPEEVSRAVVVLDGPLAVGAPPSSDRAVDSGCGTGGFSKRAQPTPVSHPSSDIFVRTTYAVIDALGPEARASIWVGGSLPNGLVLAETNPTVALAMLLPQQQVDTIPTRSRPRLFNERSVRAKSDWYWRLGGGAIIAEALGCTLAAKELDHERVAALTCLALACQLASGSLDGSGAIALGDSRGIYVVSNRHDASWTEDVRRIGVHGGAAEPISRPMVRLGNVADVKVETARTTQSSDDTDSDRGDDVDLLVCDGGGVWSKHNPWLDDLDAPIEFEAIGPLPLRMRLKPAAQHARSGQWTINPSAEAIATELGHAVPLSLRNAFVIRGRLLSET